MHKQAEKRTMCGYVPFSLSLNHESGQSGEWGHILVLLVLLGTTAAADTGTKTKTRRQEVWGAPRASAIKPFRSVLNYQKKTDAYNAFWALLLLAALRRNMVRCAYVACPPGCGPPRRRGVRQPLLNLSPCLGTPENARVR